MPSSQDSLPCLRSSKADPPRPLTRVRPLSDIYPFQGQAERSAATSLLSGCGAVVQPVSSEALSEESRLNGLNAAAWSSPVIGQPEGKPQPSRIIRLFSNPRKGPVPGLVQPTQGPHGTNGPQAWPGFSGLAMDSFKKLRSSVLQGIQSRGTNQDGDGVPTVNRQADNGTALTNGKGDGAGHFRCREGLTVSNGDCLGQRLTRLSQCSSECEFEDEEDDEDDDGNGLGRNTRFSRSIRRAYRTGRISLVDMGLDRRGGSGRDGTVDMHTSAPGSEVNLRAEEVNVNNNVKVLSRLSKSAENLSLFKTPFRRKAPTPEPVSPSSPQPDSPETSRENLGANIQRTASASSVDLRGRSPKRWKSPLRAKGHMLKLVGSVGELSTRRRSSPSPGPSPVSPVSPHSRLHDDYSRRTPCVPASERQRRPSPGRKRASGESTEATLGHPELGSEAEPVRHQVLVSPVRAEPSEEMELAAHSLSSGHEPVVGNSTCASGYGLTITEDYRPLLYSEPAVNKDQTNEGTSDQQGKEALLHVGETSPTGTSTPPLSPACSPESPASPAATGTSPTEAAAAAASAPVSHRRRSGRSRPRPISDYGQLASRKFSIPEEEAELRPEDRAGNATPRRGDCGNGGDSESGGDSPDSCGVNGDAQDRRQQRPVSVIGGVDLFSSPGSEEREERLPSPLSRPPLPSHQVPPYRGVSARFRPSSALSQSTPIGLDRLGRHKLHRVLSDGVSECAAALDDSVSEEDGSFDELSDVTPYLQPGVEPAVLNEWIQSGHAVYAEALWDHVTMEEHQLAFKAQDVIRILDASHNDWWWGRGADGEAWFPSSFVRVRVNQEDSSGESVESVAVEQEESPGDAHGTPHGTGHSTAHRQQMRTNVVQEIMNTERVYIKHLRDICEGYIRQCRKNPGMFTELQLKTIFSNIEDIYKFQRQFLRDLEKKYNKEQPHLSEIGSCFLLQGEGFSIYSEYCNTHPAACAELQRLMKLGRYKHFFEACRLLQQMIDISIAGFLLTPVQKICKYPLQLGELLKYTPKDHSDYRGVSDAYEAMKNVASLINESKRRLESLDAIAHWQVAILRWEGADVLERSSELIHSGEMVRVVRHGKTQQRSFFLFDHQLVFCKKDVLRRDLLHYRGRLDMDQTEVLELPDGRDPDLGLSLRNALRLRNSSTLESLCVLCCRKPQDKDRWLQAFARERRRVQEDQEMGMKISEEQRKQAIHNARKSKQGKMKSIGYSGSVPPPHQNLLPLPQRHVTVPTSVPQQQVYALAEPPKRKPTHLWYSFTRSAFFRK